MNYEPVIGLETHIELSTRSKIFCGCSTSFGAHPNSHCCPICLGLPGALPQLNRQAVVSALLAGLSLNCEINSKSKFDRKNYNYPDLPKGYQITQQRIPLCQNGFLRLTSGKRIPVLQIHLEEDAGKLVHRTDGSYVDFNRAGVPLIEIVTAPAFSTSLEAGEYLDQLRLLIKHLGISDCRMQEGSLRCDVNISVRAPGMHMGSRVEIKNLNAISFVQKAIAYEFSRQCALLEAGVLVPAETRRYNELTGTTEKMRGKEKTSDYRYFPDPDLPTLELALCEIEQLRASLPELPEAKRIRYCDVLGLTAESARLLIHFPRAARYFELVCAARPLPPPAVAHLIIGQLFSYLSTEAERDDFPISIVPADLGELLHLQLSGKLGSSRVKVILAQMLANNAPLSTCLLPEDLQAFTATALSTLCRQAIATAPNAVADYRAGKHKALQVLIGRVMKQSSGRANPIEVRSILEVQLQNPIIE